MKDKEAREQAHDIELQLSSYPSWYSLGELYKAIGNVSLKDCPKCNHPVLAQYFQPCTHNSIEHAHYQCLTCGSNFTCSQKAVCQLIE